ncbi:MAG: trigger factor [Acidobacteria bacterium]|nr:trigger factor [Acidobacteriota bacterium]
MTPDTNTCQRELEIEIPAEVVEKETQRVTREFTRLARIPGFRPGKAPAELVRRRFWDDIKSEVLHSLIPSSLQNAFREGNLNPVGNPSIAELQFEPAKPLRFKASFEVLPEFTLGEFKGLSVEAAKVEVTDQDVEQELERLREQAATYMPVEDRPAEDGDTVVASLVGVVTNAKEKREPLVLDEVEVHLGEEGTMEAFSQGLQGVRAEEERQFDAPYPDGYPDARLAGQTVAFTARVKAVRRKQLPTLDDEFAQQVGNYKTVQELTQKLRQDMQQAAARQEKELTQQRLLDELLSRHEFPLPEALVQHQIDMRLERRVRALVAQGIDPQQVQVDWAKVRRDQREGAIRDLKLGLLLERIAKVENLQSTEEEVASEIERLAQSSNQTPEAVRARLTKEQGLDRIESAIRSEKVIEFLHSQARIAAPGRG